MRKWLLGIGIAIAVLIVAVFAAVSLIDVDKYRPRIQAELQAKLNRPVTLGKLSLKVLPLSVRIANVTISDAPGLGTTRPFAQAQEVFASVGLFSLLRGSPAISSLQLEHPQIELIKGTNGQWNFASMGQSGSGTQSKGSGDSSGGQQFTLDKLQIRDGQIGYTDLSQHEPRVVYDHIDLTLTDYAPNKRFGLDLGIHLPGEGKQLASLKAKVGPIPAGNAANTPLDGHVTLDQVSLDGVSRFMKGALPERTDAVVTGDADLKTDNQLLLCKGKLTLDKTVLRGTAIGYPVDVTYDLSADRAKNILKVGSADLKLGSTPLSFSGTIDSAKTPATLDVKLNAKNASLTELARLAGAAGVAFNPNYKVAGTVTADVAARGTTKQPSLSGRLDARNLEISGGEIKQPVRTPAVEVNMTPQLLKTNAFTLEAGSTRLNAEAALSQYTTPNSVIDARIRTSNANIGELLAMAKAYGVDAANGVDGNGTLSLDARVQGPTSRTAALVYSGSGSISNATLTTPSLTKPVQIRSANIQLDKNSAAVSNLVASIASTTVQGNLKATDLAAPHVQFALSANNLNVSELQQITRKQTATAPAASTPRAKTASRTASRATPSSSPLERVTGNGTLAVGTLSSDELVLTNVHANCKLDRGVITLSPLTADLFGGHESGTLTMDTRPAATQVSLKSDLKSVDANKLLSAVSSVKNTLFGSLGANGSLGFALVPGGNLAQTLNGDLSFAVTNGHLRNINILSALSSIGKFTGSTAAQKQEGTQLQKLGGTLAIKNGVASTDNLAASLPEGSLSAKGIVNLVSQALDMHMTAVLAQGASQAVGGLKVGGYMNTALSNRQGELVLPVIVTGTLQKPSFAPDVQSLAKMKLNNLLPTVGNPGKLSTGVLGGVLGGKGGVGGLLGGLAGGKQASQENQDQNAAPQKQNKTEDAVDSIFNALKKKK